jgi:hypothetical protein
MVGSSIVRKMPAPALPRTACATRRQRPSGRLPEGNRNARARESDEQRDVRPTREPRREGVGNGRTSLTERRNVHPNRHREDEEPESDGNDEPAQTVPREAEGEQRPDRNVREIEQERERIGRSGDYTREDDHEERHPRQGRECPVRADHDHRTLAVTGRLLVGGARAGHRGGDVIGALHGFVSNPGRRIVSVGAHSGIAWLGYDGRELDPGLLCPGHFGPIESCYEAGPISMLGPGGQRCRIENGTLP